MKPPLEVRHAVLEQMHAQYRVEAYRAWAQAQALAVQKPFSAEQEDEHLRASEDLARLEQNCLAAAKRLQELIDQLGKNGDPA